MAGQINPDSPFGKAIMSIASADAYKTFLDVGTWNGLGTTRCLVTATNKRAGTMIYSVEANRDMFNMATQNWLKTSPPNLKFLHGKIASKIMSYEEITQSPLFESIQNHFMRHYGQDCYDFANAPIVELPPQIDVVILDGGEFCGAGDLEAALRLQPKVIALDDTMCMKNSANLERLSKSEEWECLEKSSERNGWAIFITTSP